jgi:4a-hydroxytetrahydrobiopterin dehydratase
MWTGARNGFSGAADRKAEGKNKVRAGPERIAARLHSFFLGRKAKVVRMVSMEKLSAAKIPAALAAVPEWRQLGNAITRTYAFKDFPAAMKFVNAVAGLAEQAGHHPDIDIRWNRVTLALTTHDAGGLTEKDFALAGKFDERLLG